MENMLCINHDILSVNFPVLLKSQRVLLFQQPLRGKQPLRVSWHLGDIIGKSFEKMYKTGTDHWKEISALYVRKKKDDFKMEGLYFSAHGVCRMETL